MRRLATILTAGLLLTLMVAWPAAVAAEWLGHVAGEFGWKFTKAFPSDPGERTTAVPEGQRPRGGRIEFATGWLAETHRMFPSNRGTADRPIPAWPSGDMLREPLISSRADTSRPYRPPAPVAGPPTVDEAIRWGRIDTGLYGFPFRCFASEAWYPATSWMTTPIPHDPEPQVRHAVELGRPAGNVLLLPLRPIWPGLVANVLFWSTLVWATFVIPPSIQARRRRLAGRCVGCGNPREGAAACAECGGYPADPARSHLLSQPEMLHQRAYVWFVFVSALDVMLTWKILDKGGDEVNPVAREVIGLWGFEGAILFKFALVVWVVIACELVGRRRPATGRRLAWTAVAVSAAPVVYSLGLLLDHLVLRPVG